MSSHGRSILFFFQAEDGIRDYKVTGVQTCALPILKPEAALQNSTNKGWTFSVKDQINGAASNSRLAGAAPVPNGTNPIPSLFLLDAERKALTLCERDKAGVWQVVRNLPLPLSDFADLRPVALGSTNLNAVAFLGLNAVAYLPLEGPVWELT